MVNLNLKKYLAEIEKNNQKGKKINAILQVNPCVSEDAKKVRDGKLAGKIIRIGGINQQVVFPFIRGCFDRLIYSVKSNFAW